MKNFIGAVVVSLLTVSGFISAFPSSAESVKGYGVVCGMTGDYNQWDRAEAQKNGSEVALITGDGQYEATWKIDGEGTESIDFLMLEIKESEELGYAFTSDCLPELSLKVDSVTVNGSEIELNDNEKAYNLAYYETEEKRGARAYLADSWGINPGGTLGVPENTAVTGDITVKFTVSGIDENKDRSSENRTDVQESTGAVKSTQTAEVTDMQVPQTDSRGTVSAVLAMSGAVLSALVLRKKTK